MDQAILAKGEERPCEKQSSRLSYKFQRLREKLRTAVVRGELSGKLPGERQLAKRFHVNAKTLSKALTDLAAEGVLDRSIGRGTFVKGSGTPAPANHERWLVICDPDQTNSKVIDYLQQMNQNLQVVTDTTSLRPSLLNAVKAVIVQSSSTPDAFIRDLVVRNITVVLVGREPSTYSVNAVLVDRALGASYLARDMMLWGHRHFVAVERRGQSSIAEAIRRAAARYAPEASVDSAHAADVPHAVEQGASAVICDSRRTAVQTCDALQRQEILVPARASVAAIGSGWGDYPCSGYFVHSQQKAQTVVQLIRDLHAKRPTTLWLTGEFVDCGSIAPLAEVVAPAAILTRSAASVAAG